MKKYTWDIVAIIAILLVSISIYTMPFSKPKQIKISKDGKVVAMYDFGIKKQVNVKNVFISINEDSVSITSSDCNDKLCIGTIKKTGQSLVCLPNKIVVSIEGERDFDAVSY